MIRIAIVEDEDSYIQILSGYLEHMGKSIPFPSTPPPFMTDWISSQIIKQTTTSFLWISR